MTHRNTRRIVVALIAAPTLTGWALPVRQRIRAEDEAPSVPSAPSVAAVGPVPSELRDRLGLSEFYKKHIPVGEFPILSSENVSDYALLEARYIVTSMLAGRDDILRELVRRKFRLTVMAHDELTTDVPEHSDLRPRKYWDRRARGLGATARRPCVSCGEENLLQLRGDPYSTENILVHEFAHTIHEALKTLDGDVQGRLEDAYTRAKEKGLWSGKYAARNVAEYWAEAVQSYFCTNRENDHDHNHVNTRRELEAYDPDLAALVAEVFRNSSWRYVPPSQRAEPDHLAGYDATTAPQFAWPERIRNERLRGDPADSTARRPGPIDREVEGWTVLVDPRLLDGPGKDVGAEALDALRLHLYRIRQLVDDERLRKLRELEIWIELDNPGLKSMQYHPSKGWLRGHDHDERLAKKVHIPHARSLLSRREAAKHPWVVLHELAHAYQDRFVGWDDERLKACYEKAVESGSYDSVLHIFGGRTRHYALSNHHEYFAEGTESYFGRNDFYPFVQAELKEHDPDLHEFLRDVWGPVP